MSGPEGQARTDFRAYRIPPGTHVLEIKGDSRYQPWKQEVDVEAGAIRKVRAILVMVGSPTPSPPPAPERPRPAPSAPPAQASNPASAPQAPPLAGDGSNGALAAGGAKQNRNEALLAAARRHRTGRDLGDGDPSRAGKSPGDDGESSAGGGGDCAITVGTRPWSELWIDGKNTGRHTPYSEAIACGKHKLTFRRPDLNLDRTESVTIRAGEKFKQSYALEGESE